MQFQWINWIIYPNRTVTLIIQQPTNLILMVIIITLRFKFESLNLKKNPEGKAACSPGPFIGQLDTNINASRSRYPNRAAILIQQSN